MGRYLSQCISSAPMPKGAVSVVGCNRFAFVAIGPQKMSPHQIADEYRRRLGIETSCRLTMNRIRARTTSRSAEWRLFLVSLALLLLNL
jgi:IS4 transposase